MSVAIRFHPAAREELEAAFAWYEEQEAGLGLALLEDLDRSLTQVALMPNAWPTSPLDPRARYIVLARFPYRVVYLSKPEEVVIVAVAHKRRRPGYWRVREP